MTFAEIYAAVCNAIGDTKQSRIAQVKVAINQVYLNEVMACDVLWPLFWLLDFVEDKGSLAPVTITGITKANPAVVSVVNSLADGDLVSIYNVAGMVEVNNRTFKVANRAAGSVELQNLDGTNINSSSFTAYTSGGSLVHRGLTLTNIDSIWGTPKWHGEDKMTRIGVEELEDSTYWWDESTARPERFFHRKAYASNAEINQLLWFRGADAAYDLRFWKVKPVTALSNDADVPVLPGQFHHTLIAGAVARLAEVRKDSEIPLMWPQLYADGKEAIIRFNRAWWNEKGVTA